MKIIKRKVLILGEKKEQIELIADEGYIITTKKECEEGQEQIYSDHLFLSFSDSVDNYVEILESEIPEKEELLEGE